MQLDPEHLDDLVPYGPWLRLDAAGHDDFPMPPVRYLEIADRQPNSALVSANVEIAYLGVGVPHITEFCLDDLLVLPEVSEAAEIVEDAPMPKKAHA